jgi:hypothetical protein
MMTESPGKSGAAATADGWRLHFLLDGSQTPDGALRDELTALALARARGDCPNPLRRSRHAATYMERLAEGESAPMIVYIKLYDSPRGFERVKRTIVGSRARAALAGTRAVSRAGLNAPSVLLLGEQGRGGRALIVTRRVDGKVLPRFLAGCDRTIRRNTIRRLGAEIAAFHKAGLIHGDLTPFNIFVLGGEAPRFAFIDHERTGRARWFNVERRRLRNLVQLGRFQFDFISRTDRMRFYTAWARAIAVKQPRATLRRLLAMLRARIEADRGLVHMTAGGRVTIRQGASI